MLKVKHVSVQSLEMKAKFDIPRKKSLEKPKTAGNAFSISTNSLIWKKCEETMPQ